jgi:hypothetical protein
MNRDLAMSMSTLWLGKLPELTLSDGTKYQLLDAKRRVDEAHADGPKIEPLIAPCGCRGKRRFMHESCLQQQFFPDADDFFCDMCGEPYTGEPAVRLAERSIAYLLPRRESDEGVVEADKEIAALQSDMSRIEELPVALEQVRDQLAKLDEALKAGTQAMTEIEEATRKVRVTVFTMSERLKANDPETKMLEHLSHDDAARQRLKSRNEFRLERQKSLGILREQAQDADQFRARQRWV